MTRSKALVVGASGFLGSHVTRRLAAAGRPVRILVRPASDTQTTDDLALERHRGDVLDPDSLRGAYDGCAAVFHCVVDTRAWVRDPTSLYRVNVEGLVNSMSAALAAGVQRFVLTSTIGTIGRNPTGIATEADRLQEVDSLPHYLRARFKAEQTFFDWVRERGLPGVACCVGNTYGPGDVAPTPHGRIIAAAAGGRMPAYIDGVTAAVGVEDAAEALILAEVRGRVGERYIVSERGLTQGELIALAAAAGGSRARSRRLPLPVAYALAWVAQTAARLRGQDSQLCVESVRLSHIIDDMDATKARTELGWQPRPVEEAIRAAVRFYAERGLIPGA